MTDFGPEDLIACYRRGVFPMAESSAEGGLFLVDPEWRCVMPLDDFYVPRRLARTVRADRFEITIDREFSDVVRLCGESAPDRPETWINADIRRLYQRLHEQGLAHSVEARQDGRLVGGLYGVSLGGAFFGESMFSRARDASKVALVHLAARLCAGGYGLLDAQFITEHLMQFGAVTLPRRAFREKLNAALAREGDFFALPEGCSGAQALQSIAQMS